MIPLIAGWLGKSVLMQSPIGGFLKSLTPRAWLHIAIVAAVVVGFFVHQHKARSFGKERFNAGVASEAARIEAKAREIERKAAALSEKSRKLNDETNRRIDDRARSLLVRGPGKAACSVSIPAASGGRVEASGSGNAPLARVPYPEWQQLIGLPFTSTVEFARLCDLNRAEVLTWRQWHKDNEALHSEGSKP